LKKTVGQTLMIVLAATAVAVSTGISGAAQTKTFRRGGPRDWSAGRLVASRFGPDADRNIDKDWRTYVKHLHLDQARALRTSPTLDWFDLLQQMRGPTKPKPAADSHLDWSLKTGGYGNVVGAPAKYSFDISASNCSDVIYFTVDQAGAAATPNVVAITNAYAGCPGNAAGTTPSVKWAIAMTAGTATSAVPSLDGTVLYVLESRGTGVILHAINVNNITSTPGAYNFGTQLWTSTHTLAAPTGLPTSEQLFQITFAGVVNNVASPYLDYTNNQIFFGDNAGRIHHVVNTHLTTAARDLTNFTNTCGTAQLTSPVFINNQVIVTSYNGRLYRLDTAGASPYACISAAQGGTGTGAGIAGSLSAPVVDVSNSQIIIGSNNASGFGVSGIGILDLTFAAGAAQTSGVMVGNGVSTAPVSPAFDDAFWSTNNGNLYAVGSRISGGIDTYLLRIPYNGTALGAVSGFAQLHRGSGVGAVVSVSPVTEFLTASALANKDFIFVGGGSGGTSNYLFMNRIGAGFGGGDTAPVVMDNWFAVPGGVISPIVIDTRTSNITGGTAQSNIYFGTIGIAASLTQSTIVQLAQQF
jgi:hypothetical protein